MLTGRYSRILLSALIVQNVLSEAFSEMCTTEWIKVGVCANLTDCPIFKTLLEAPGLRSDFKVRIRTGPCGFDINKPKICCPSASVKTDPGRVTDNLLISPPDVTTHPNLSLLPETCGPDNSDLLLGGIHARLFEFPWMALLSYKTGNDTRFRCSGSIINSKYILTAAHCIETQQTSKLVSVRVGEYDIITENDCEESSKYRRCSPPVQDLEIEEVIIHPSYITGSTKGNDIGLIRVKDSIDINKENVYPVCLPISQEDAKRNLDGERLTLTSWGDVRVDSPFAILQENRMAIVDNQKCKDVFKTSKVEIDHKQICAVRSYIPKELLEERLLGGSGGSPLQRQTFKNSRSRYIQYGITSMGPTRISTTIPEIYTAIPYYMDWVLDQLKP